LIVASSWVFYLNYEGNQIKKNETGVEGGMWNV